MFSNIYLETEVLVTSTLVPEFPLLNRNTALCRRCFLLKLACFCAVRRDLVVGKRVCWQAWRVLVVSVHSLLVIHLVAHGVPSVA